jgi:RecA-family ATPase
MNAIFEDPSSKSTNSSNSPESDVASVAQFPILNRGAAKTFLQCLDPKRDEFTFQTFTDSDQRKKTYDKHPQTGRLIDPVAKVLHGTLDQHWATLVDYSRRGAGIFVTVNRTSLRGHRNSENIKEIRSQHVDCDGVSPDSIRRSMEALGLPPHIGVQSSRGKYHVYYRVHGVPLNEYSQTQKRLIRLFGSDPTVHDLPRVMRVPGFPHQKDGSNNELVRLLHTSDRDSYSNADFQAALTRALELQARNRPLKERALDGIGEPSPAWNQGFEEGHRNNECARRAGLAISEGATPEEALEECLQWNRLNKPPLSEEEVHSVVRSIWRTHERKEGAKSSSSSFQNDDPALQPFNTYRGDELLATAALPRRWFVEGLVPAEETTMLGGDGGAGKTTLALQLVVSGITGKEWFGRKVVQRNMLYISAEDPVEEIHFRLEQITKSSPLAKGDLARFKLIDLAGKVATLAIFDKSGQLKLTPLLTAIETIAREHNAGCIIFDAIADFFGGNENERREVRAFVGALRGMAMRLKAAVLFIAHPSVDGIKTGRGYSGSTHWNNAVRSRLYFYDAPSDENAGPPSLDMRVLELAKSNRARRGEKIHLVWFDGCFTTVAPGAAENLTNAAEADRIFLAALEKMTSQGVNLSTSPSSTYAPTVLAKMPMGKRIGKAALDRAMHRLIERGVIRAEPFGPPSHRRHRLIVTGRPSVTEGA